MIYSFYLVLSIFPVIGEEIENTIPSPEVPQIICFDLL
jgi:hypothetical protein